MAERPCGRGRCVGRVAYAVRSLAPGRAGAVTATVTTPSGARQLSAQMENLVIERVARLSDTGPATPWGGSITEHATAGALGRRVTFSRRSSSSIAVLGAGGIDTALDARRPGSPPSPGRSRAPRPPRRLSTRCCPTWATTSSSMSAPLAAQASSGSGWGTSAAPSWPRSSVARRPGRSQRFEVARAVGVAAGAKRRSRRSGVIVVWRHRLKSSDPLSFG